MFDKGRTTKNTDTRQPKEKLRREASSVKFRVCHIRWASIFFVLFKEEHFYLLKMNNFINDSKGEK